VQGKTHVLIGCLTVAALTHHGVPASLAAATLGSLAPDIDRTGSLITTLPVIRWFTHPASMAVSAALRHRTGTHSLLTLLALTVGVLMLQHTVTPVLGAAFLAGYLLHLLADSLTITGVPLLWPWRKHEFSPLPKPLRIRTGGRAEYLLTMAVLVAGLWSLKS
jgi:inner membrane protein